jgi:predicted anti-sigma-YlaC factor YlaD
MNCARVRDLFGAYWDDEITQAEREWIESHFTSCITCREEYEGFSRTLEAVSSLPREDASPDLVERVLASARRTSPSADRLPVRSVSWVPAAAAAALVALTLATLSPWSPLATRHASRSGSPVAMLGAPGASAVSATPRVPERRSAAAGTLASVSDSVFDHTEDVEFILDPVTVKRGRVRPATSRPPVVQGERAVITF